MTTTDIPQSPEASVVDLIDAIEEIVTTGRRVPFSANVVVNEDETLELIDRARLGLPEELVRARHTVGERESILESADVEAQALLDAAQKQAAAIMTEAEARAAILIADHEILQLAQARADTLVVEAEAGAASTRDEADAYAREVMEELDRHLTRSLATVRKGLETLPNPSRSGHGRKGRKG